MLKTRFTELFHHSKNQKFFFQNRKTSISLYSKNKNYFSYKRLVKYTNFIQNIIRVTLRTFSSEKNNIKRHLIKTPLIIKIKESIFDKYITLDSIIEILSKPKNLNKYFDYKVLSYYISENYKYFTKLKKNNEEEKIFLLSTVMNLEIFKEGETIIKYDTEYKKFYIILSGKVKFYKPYIIYKEMMVKDFIIYLNNLKEDKLTLERIERKNCQIYNIHNIQNNNYDYEKLPDCYNLKKFYIEENILFDEKESGNNFGEIALLNNEKSNTNIIASSNCILVSIKKKDYEQIIKEIEEKQLNDFLEKIKMNLIVFKNFEKEMILKYLSLNTKIHLEKGDYLYKQNDESNYIYLIINGLFECSIQLNYSNFEKLKYYFNKNTKKFFSWLKKNEKNEIYINEINNFFRKNLKENGLIPYQIINEENNIIELNDLFLKELEIKDSNKLINIKFRTININDIIGLEEAFECKYRFYSIKCISNEGKVNRIDIGNFIDFFRRKNIPFTEIKKIILERKKTLLNQIKTYLNIEKRNEKRFLSCEYNRFKKVNGINTEDNLIYKLKKTPNLHKKILSLKNFKRKLRINERKKKKKTTGIVTLNNNLKFLSSEKYPNIHSRNLSKIESKTHLNLSPNSTATSSVRKIKTLINSTKPSLYTKTENIDKYEKEGKLQLFLSNLRRNEYNYNYLRKQIHKECGFYTVNKRKTRNFSNSPFNKEFEIRLINLKKEKSFKYKSVNDFSFVSNNDISFNDISYSHIHIPIIKKKENNFEFNISNKHNIKSKNIHL